MQPLFRAFVQNIPYSINQRIYTALANQKERITFIVLGVIACIAFSYTMSRYLFKDKFKQIEVIKKEDDSVTNKTTENETVTTEVAETNATDEYGTLNGKGKRKYPDEVIAEGDFIDGQLDCKDGLMVLPGGEERRGEFKEGNLVHGTITGAKGTVILEGFFLDDLLHGEEGKITWKDGTVVTGKFEKGKLNGSGEKTFPSGHYEKGNFKDDELNGDGYRKYSDGIEEEGIFADGEFIFA